MKDITAFIFDLSKGGAQGVFVTVMNYFAREGYKVRVVVQNLNDAVHKDELHDSIEMHSLETNSAKDSLMKLIKYVRKNNIENAWVFGPELAVNLYIAKKITGKKFPIYARSINTLSEEFKRTNSFFRKYVTHSLIRMLYHKVNAIVAQSINMGNDLIDNYDFKKSQVYVINNALSDIYDQEIRNPVETLKYDYLLYVGRLEEQKGLKMLLKSFAMMDNKAIKLFIVGEGSQKEELIQVANDLGISNRVDFVGYASDVLDYYRGATATVLTSYYEGFPNVLIESIACGTPVIAFDLPSGPKEIINDDNGLLVKYLDVAKMAAAFDIAIEKNWDRNRIKASAGRYSQQTILHKYSEMM